MHRARLFRAASTNFPNPVPSQISCGRIRLVPLSRIFFQNDMGQNLHKHWRIHLHCWKTTLQPIPASIYKLSSQWPQNWTSSLMLCLLPTHPYLKCIWVPQAQSTGNPPATIPQSSSSLSIPYLLSLPSKILAKYRRQIVIRLIPKRPLLEEGQWGQSWCWP